MAMKLVDFAAPSERRLGLRLYLKESTPACRRYLLQVVETQDKSSAAIKVHKVLAGAGFAPGDLFGDIGLQPGKRKSGWEFSGCFPLGQLNFEHPKYVSDAYLLASLDALGLQDASRFSRTRLNATRNRLFAQGQKDLQPLLQNRGLPEYILHMVAEEIEKAGGEWIRHNPTTGGRLTKTEPDMARWLKNRGIKTRKWYPITDYKAILHEKYILKDS